MTERCRPTDPRQDDPPRLRSGRLPHLTDLRIDPVLFEPGFARQCDTRRCGGACCQVGVWVDVAHRDLILAHAARVRRTMDPGQEHDPTRWFGDAELDDPDFPSGRAVDTLVRAGGCVFLNGAGRCVLQMASLGEERGELDLKPFFCAVFPLVVADGVVTFEDEFPDHPQCCSPSPGGELSPLEAFGSELRYVVGESAADELRRLAGPAGR